MIVRSHIRNIGKRKIAIRSHVRNRRSLALPNEARTARRRKRVGIALGAAALGGGALAFAKRKKLADLLRPIKGNAKAGMKKFNSVYMSELLKFDQSRPRVKAVVG